MKKTLLFLAIILMTNIAFSQIIFSDTLDNHYSNGDTLLLPNDSGDGVDDVYFDVFNSNPANVEFIVEVIEYDKPNGTYLNMCANGVCGEINTVPERIGDTTEIGAGEYSDNMHISYMHFGTTEYAFIKVKATNVNDANDTAVISFKTSETTNILEQKAQISKINIYPNPVSKILSIYYTDVNQDIISIINSTGEIVQQTQINSKSGSVSINISELKQGIYFVKIGNKSKKFIKRN